ncbi:hypothetical protein [Rariglobus hedericola]|uniref:Uncharacterized protein n=1 Tax=Rariglobus hedericola TaxID=2597822 RepID=A0A556QQM0_9BACT|nr:hypothetical protein [Rariglobus hedericola]TSJ78932.1 hypothetical protein FPL22_06410 [Rariglobus hedericola]
MRRFTLIFAALATVTAARAQSDLFNAPNTGTAAPAAATGTAANATGSRAGATESLARAVNINSLESGTLLQIINQAFDTNSDSINPENGTMNWKGHSYDMGQFRVFRGRFERYLSLPPTRDQDVYGATLDEIFKLLSTRTANGSQDSVVEAWKLLYRASEYDADGGNSLGVANQIFNAWRIRDEKQAFTVTQTELQRIRRQQSASVVYAGDTMAAETGKNAADAISGSAILGNLSTGNSNDSGGTTTTTGNNGTTTTTGGQNGSRNNNNNNNNNGNTQPKQTIGGSSTVGPVGQLFRARELAETEAKIKSLEAAGLLSVTQAKLQFQSQIMSLFLQRRFQHALIASSFYRYIFKGSHQNLEVGKKELSSFLPSTDLALTVETIEFLSREAINDINSGMAAVRSNYDDGRKVAALERLQETFFLGEYMPAVTQFEPARKEALLTLYRKVDEARKLADLRDYDAVIGLTEEIGTLTKDFRAPEVNAAVRSAQRMSTLSLNAAQQAAATGNYSKAQEFVEKAAQLWPLNPAIKNYTENMASQADLGTQAGVVFDDAFKRDDFRRIYEKRAELAVAFLNDNVRGPQLKAVIDRMARVEIYLAQTEELLAQNNAYSAWEALAAATAFAPNDVILNQRMAQLAPRVAEFIGRLDQAKRYETEQRYAASLTQYLAAQDIHPASQIARTGLTRVSESIMTQLATEVPVTVEK